MTQKRVVYKYAFPGRKNEDDFLVPKNAKLVHFGIDGVGDFCFWAEHPLGEIPSEIWKMGFYGTGHPFEADGEHQGSVVTHNGFVFHLYRFPEK